MSALALRRTRLLVLACAPIVWAGSACKPKLLSHDQDLSIVGHPPPPPPPPPPEPEPPPPPPPKAALAGDAFEFEIPLSFVEPKNVEAALAEGCAEVLDDLVSLLEASPTLTRIAITVHTDAEGRKRDNKALTEAQAAVIRDYLVGKGIDQARLEVHAMGETRPLPAVEGEEDTAARHQRVELTVLERAEEPNDPEEPEETP